VETYGITLMYGRPRHLLTQGLIEQANAVLKHKAKNRSRFMRLHVLPLPDLWLAANAKAYVLTVAANAKKRGVHVLPTAILGQGSTHVRFRYKRWQSIDQAEQAGDCTSRAFPIYFFIFFLIYFPYVYISCIKQ